MSKIVLPIAELKPALVGLGKVILKRCTLPVLQCVRIERNPDGWITLTGTDLKAFATVRLEQPSEGYPATILVPYNQLVEIAKLCESQESITLEPLRSIILIEYPIGSQVGSREVDIIDPTEFPVIPKFQGDRIALSNKLRDSIHEALNCASVDPTRHVLNSAFIDSSEVRCNHIVGTDGKHLYSANSFSLPLTQSVKIPTHKFLYWRGFNSDGEWRLRVMKNEELELLEITTRRWRYIVEQPAGEYPRWKVVLPNDNSFKATVYLTPEAMETVAKMLPKMPCHDEANQTIGIRLMGRKLYLRGKNVNDTSWTQIEVPDVRVKGNPVAVYLDRRFLAKAMKYDLGEIEIADDMSPLRFFNKGRQMIVTPVRET